MKVSHIAVYTNDLERLRCFYEKYFHGKSNEKYHNIVTGLETYFITFEDFTRLEIMTRPNLIEHEVLPLSTGFAHIAFSIGNKENVDSLTQQLVKDGYSLISAPRITGDGYYESCIYDPDKNIIEIVE